MKWQMAPVTLRLATRRERVETAKFAAPLTDVLAYFAAAAAGIAPVRSQIVGFIAGAALSYTLHIRADAAARAPGRNTAFHLHLIFVTLMALFVRSGVFALVTTGWGWPAQAAILFAVLASVAVLRTGYGWCLSFAEWNLGAGAGWRVLAGGVVTLAFLIRLVYGAPVELLPEEAYYWNYSQHLDFGYLDHPPMVSWLISLGTAVFGNSEFGVRIGALCCGAISSFYMYRLARDLFGEPSALVAVVLLQALPFFFFAGMLMTPDAPLTAAWVATFYHIERAVIAGRGKAWWGVGVCFGLGLLSKYTIGLLGASTLIFMLLDARASRWLRRPEPYAAALLALALFSPVIFWNAHHDWASFAFQTSRRLADPPRFALPHFMGSILVLLTPTGLVAAGIMLLGRRPDAFTVEGAGDKARAWRLIQVSIVVPLAVFAVFSLRHEVKLDWTGAPWVASLPALAFGVVQSGGRLRQGARAWVRGAWAPTIIVLLLIYGAGLEYLVLGLPGVGYTRHTELVPVGWRDFGDQIHAIAQDAGKASGSEPLIVGMDRYAIASEVAFYSLDRSRSVAGTSSGHLFGAVGLMYETWFPREQQQGRNMLLVAWNREDLAQDRVAASVSRLEPIHTGALMRGDELIRLYYYRMADGYRGITEPH